MKKLTIELDIDSPQDIRNIIDAASMRCAIDTYYDKVFRPYLKYGSDELQKGQVAILEEVAEKLEQHFKECLE